MKTQRPINLDFLTIKFPLSAIVSILHRISGACIFFIIALVLYLLDMSLSSVEGFSKIINLMDNKFVKFIIWCLLTVMTYHMISGMRHIIMDLGYMQETLPIIRITASIVLILTIIISIILGVFLW